MPHVFGAVMALIIPPVRIVTGHTISVPVLFLSLSALVTAPVIPMGGVTAFRCVAIPELIARALVALSAPVMRGITAFVTVPMLIMSAVVAFPIVPTVRAAMDLVAVLIVIGAHSVTTRLHGRSSVDNGRQDGESGNNLRDKHIERMSLYERRYMFIKSESV
jgi:hypothetical protein